MNECKFSTSRLVELLNKHLETPEMPIPEDLANHAQTCPVCARLLTEESMARAFISFYRNRYKTENISNPLRQQHCAVSPGQLWRFFFGPEKQSEFCLITSDPFKGHKDLDLAVRIAPLYLSPNPQELGPSDLLIPSTENTLGVPLLIETWNERPILCAQLMEYKGQLEEGLFNKAKAQLKEDLNEALTSTVRVFRRHEIARGGLFSDMTFRQLGEADTAAQALSIYNTEKKATGVKLLYIKLGKLVRELFFPEPSSGCFVCEDSAATIFAASESKDNLFLKALYSRLARMFEINEDLPFRIRQPENNALQLLHTGRQNFLLQVKMTCGSTFEMTSSNGICHINEKSAGLPDSESIALITLKEK